MTLIRRLILALALSAWLAPAFAQAPAAVPALPDTERRTSYSISATTCACNVNFALFGDGTDYQNWVEVWLNGVNVAFNDATFGWTITVPTQTLATRSRPISDAILTFTNAQTGTVQIVGARRPRRTAQFAENAGVSARNLNQVFTDIIAQNREIWDKTNDMTGRGLFSQPGNTMGPLPLPASCANGFLGFDATGLIPQCLTGAGSGNMVGPVTATAGHVAIYGATPNVLVDTYAGATCTNQLVRVLSASLGVTCASITNSFLASGTFGNITGTGTLTAGASGAGFTLDFSASTLNGNVPVTHGGTGVATLTAHGVMLGQGTGNITTLNGSVGTTSLPLISQGAGADPSFATLSLNVLNSGTQDTAIGYWGSTTASALAVNNCTGALTYSTSTHTFGCNASAGTGTVTSAQISAGAGINVATTSGANPCVTTCNLTVSVNQTVVTNSLGTNPALGNGTYTDGPSTAQGTSGGWWASGTVTIGDTVANIGACKLWDGTNAAVASTNFRQQSTAAAGVAVSLSGFISSPAGNIRISCKSNDATATFRFNDSGESKDSTLTVHRIQ